MQCWLVERDFDDKGLVRLVYATRDGSSKQVRELSPARLGREDVTAAVEAGRDELESIDDSDLRERYADEAGRMAERHDPDDAV